MSTQLSSGTFRPHTLECRGLCQPRHLTDYPPQPISKPTAFSFERDTRHITSHQQFEGKKFHVSEKQAQYTQPDSHHDKRIVAPRGAGLSTNLAPSSVLESTSHAHYVEPKPVGQATAVNCNRDTHDIISHPKNAELLREHPRNTSQFSTTYRHYHDGKRNENPIIRAVTTHHVQSDAKLDSRTTHRETFTVHEVPQSRGVVTHHDHSHVVRHLCGAEDLRAHPLHNREFTTTHRASYVKPQQQATSVRAVGATTTTNPHSHLTVLESTSRATYGPHKLPEVHICASPRQLERFDLVAHRAHADDLREHPLNRPSSAHFLSESRRAFVPHAPLSATVGKTHSLTTDPSAPLQSDTTHRCEYVVHTVGRTRAVAPPADHHQDIAHTADHELLRQHALHGASTTEHRAAYSAPPVGGERVITMPRGCAPVCGKSVDGVWQTTTHSAFVGHKIPGDQHYYYAAHRDHPEVVAHQHQAHLLAGHAERDHSARTTTTHREHYVPHAPLHGRIVSTPHSTTTDTERLCWCGGSLFFPDGTPYTLGRVRPADLR
eukprot:gnl/Spiro4/5219_TR2630_c0_g1_i1.p1 gnl/Spiro4/5219_TR2630_c0_g1~~gnl/Spiro4/5219_TR2630_c0_g1_i1.p1  ORF type:complete len:559 (+),score=122.29 gnl/Spiro4/5219_TR2630_c0_g1_i1:39-1679(+)